MCIMSFERQKKTEEYNKPPVWYNEAESTTNDIKDQLRDEVLEMLDECIGCERSFCRRNAHMATRQEAADKARVEAVEDA